MSAGLGLHGVTVAFGPTTAVDDVTLEVEPGEVVALLGPSGCGKSTLLRVVAGLQASAAGRVTWDDEDLAPVPVHRRGFGLMFQEGQLFVHRDVAGNVAYGLAAAGVPRPARRERVAELLALVGLEGYGPRAVATLSGGEQQRVALARALAPRPRLLLLDEPLSALDRALRERLAHDLRAIVTSTGTTAVHVTHDHEEAFAVADRVAVLDGGRLRQVGTPYDVWHRPADVGVASFLGYDTVVEAAGLGIDGGGLVALRPGSLLARPVGVGGPDGGAPRGRVVGSRASRDGHLLDVRPDHLRGADGRPVGLVVARVPRSTAGRTPGPEVPPVAGTSVELCVEPGTVAMVDL